MQYKIVGYPGEGGLLDVDGDGRSHFLVEIDSFPQWLVEVVVMNSSTGLVISDLRIYPNQDGEFMVDGDPFKAKIGSRTIDVRDGPHNGLPWDGYAENVPTGGIPSGLLRAISTTELLKLARLRAAPAAEQAEDYIDSGNFEEIELRLRRAAKHNRSIETGPVSRPGRKGNGDEHYLEWAEDYDELTRAGNRQQIKTLLAIYGGVDHGKPREYIRDTIHDARRKGLLTSSGHGIPGGLLTMKAKDLRETLGSRKKPDLKTLLTSKTKPVKSTKRGEKAP
jgi:hypothetical protein